MPDLFTHNGQLFVISAASGTGKTSLISALLAEDPGLTLTISHSTRPKRVREKNGTHYHFVSKETFQAMQAEDAFVEYAEIFGDLYGTSFAALKQCLESGKDVILELDWQGALQIKEKLPSAIGIFLLPPSRDELLRRLTRRGRDPKESIEKRLSGAQVDIAHYRDFDYLVVNKDFAETRVNLAHIIQAERLRTRRQQTKLSDWLKTMLA